MFYIVIFILFLLLGLRIMFILSQINEGIKSLNCDSESDNFGHQEYKDNPLIKFPNSDDDYLDKKQSSIGFKQKSQQT